METIIAPIGEMAPADDAALPTEWAQWAEEPGKVIRFEEGQTTIGRVHAVVVGRGEGWIEGLWVAPASRRRGVGRKLLAAAEDLLRTYGVGVVRVGVPAHQHGAVALLEREGFAARARAVVYVLAVAARADSPADDMVVRPATAVEAPDIVRGIAAEPSLRPWHGLIPIGWRFRQAGTEVVRGLAKDGRVLVTRDPGGIAIMAAGGDPAVISTVGGRSGQVQRLVRAVAARAGAERVAVFAPDAATTADLGVAREPHAWCPDGLVIVEKTVTG